MTSWKDSSVAARAKVKSETICAGSGSHCWLAVRYGVVASQSRSVGEVTEAGSTSPAKRRSGRVAPSAVGSVRTIRWSASR